MSSALRRLVVVTIGLVLLLGSVTTAQAATPQSRVDAGSSYATGRGTTVGLAVLDRVTGEYRDNGGLAHQQFESASVVKVFIADNLLRRRDAGQITLSATDLADMSRMLQSSDNTPANRFWSSYGANAIVTDVIRRYGLSETGLTSNTRYWGNTLITAHDMVVYYQGLLAGSGGLSAGSRTFIIDQLQRSTQRGSDGYDQFFGLRRGLPGEAWIGQKQGWMCCVNGSIYRHSTGFVGPEGRYVIAVLSKEPSGLGAVHIEESMSGAVARMFPEGRVDLTQAAPSVPTSAIGGAGGSYFLNDRFDGAANHVFPYGDPGDEVYVGDWDGNGTDTLAVRRGNVFHVKNDTRSGVADVVFAYGDPGDTVLVGDWDGDGTDTLTVRRGSTYFVKNSLSSGAADRVFVYGDPGDSVLVGRWSATQTGDSLAVRRGNVFYLKNTTESGVADVVFAYGDASDTSFTGDWDGDGVDGVGVRRR